MQFKKTLDDLNKISSDLKREGVTVEKLDNAIEELTQHQANIEKIEGNIDAIRAEVVAPLQAELQQNKVAGKFSVFGFWVGAIGLVVSICTVIFQYAWTETPPSIVTADTAHESGRSPADELQGPQYSAIDQLNDQTRQIAGQLDNISDQLLFPSSFVVQEGEKFLGRGESISLLADKQNFKLEVTMVVKWPKENGRLAGVIRVFRGEKLLGKSALEKKYQSGHGQNTLLTMSGDEDLLMGAEDKLQLGDTTIRVMRVFSEYPEGRLIGDERSGLVIKVSKQSVPE